MSVNRVLRTAREVLLSLTAVLGVLSVLVVLAALTLGLRPLMFRSGSMSPTIDTGDLSISHRVGASDLRPGDVVSVLAANGQRVTHRVVTVTGTGTQRQLTLKGDANQVVDQQVYDVSSAYKVWFTIPKAGYVADWLGRAPGVYLVAAYVALMLVLVLRRPQSPAGTEGGASGEPQPTPRSAPEPASAPAAGRPGGASAQPEARRRRPVRAALIGGALVAGLVALAGWGMSTGAFWTDSVNVTGTSFTTTSVQAPVASCISAVPKDKTVVGWTAVSGATGYELHYGSGGNNVETVGPAVTQKAFTTNGSGTFYVITLTSGWRSTASNSLSYAQGQGNGNTGCS